MKYGFATAIGAVVVCIVGGSSTAWAGNSSRFAATTTAPTTSPADTEQIQRVQGLLAILTATDTPLTPRKIAARQLMNIPSPMAFEPLTKILASPTDRQAQMAVIRALAEQDAADLRFVDSLISLLTNTDADLAKAAAVTLGRYRNLDVIRRLTEMASSEKRPLAQRLAAISALGKTRSKASVEALIGLMDVKDNDGTTRKQLRLACAKSLQELTLVDFDTNLSAWQTWWENKKWKDDLQWVQDQLDVVIEENRRLAKLLDQTELALIESTVRLYGLTENDQTQQVELNKQYLASDLPAYRLAAIQILSNDVAKGQPIPAELLPTLRELISDTAVPVREAATRLLANGHDTGALERLSEQLEKEAEPEVKQQLLVAMGQLGQPELLTKFFPYLQSPLEPVAIGAAKAMGKMFENNSVPMALKDPSVLEVIKRFKQAGDEQTELKEELLRDMISLADRRFLPEFNIALSSASPEQRRYGVRGIAAIGDAKLVEPLLNHLNDPDAAVRAEILSRIAGLTHEESAVEKLLVRMDPNVEKNARVMTKTWQAILSIWDHWPIEQQLTWTEKRFAQTPALSAECLQELATRLMTLVDAQSPGWATARRVDMLTRVGKLVLQTNRPVDAVKYFRQALVAGQRDAQTEVAPLAEQLANTIIRASNGKPDPIVSAQYLNSVAGLVSSKELEQISELFIKPVSQNNEGSRIRPFIAELSEDFWKGLTAKGAERLRSLAKDTATGAPLHEVESAVEEGAE